MFPAEAFRPVLLKFVEVLNELGVQFHLTGGLVAVIYAEPRFTQDADFVVDRRALDANLDAFLKALRSRQYHFSEAAVREAILDGKLFQLLDTVEMLKLDVYPRELVAGELQRSTLVELLPGIRLPVVSRTDLAVAKLIWVSKGSHKSRRDVRQVLLRATVAEMQTVRQLAHDHSLDSLLDEVLAETDEPIE